MPNNQYKQKVIPKVFTTNYNLSGGLLRKKIFEYYKKKYQKKVIVKNIHLEIFVEFDRKGANKTSYGEMIYLNKTCLIEILDKLIKYAKYNNWGDRKTDDPKDVLGYLNFKAKAYIDNKLVGIHIAIRLKNDGKFHYSLEVNKIRLE